MLFRYPGPERCHGVGRKAMRNAHDFVPVGVVWEGRRDLRLRIGDAPQCDRHFLHVLPEYTKGWCGLNDWTSKQVCLHLSHYRIQLIRSGVVSLSIQEQDRMPSSMPLWSMQHSSFRLKCGFLIILITQFWFNFSCCNMHIQPRMLKAHLFFHKKRGKVWTMG